MGVPQTVNQNRSKSRASRPPTTTSPAGRNQEDQEKERYGLGLSPYEVL